ncbi:hypothetical protein ACROYT_G020706 [Oculina patagonica]
MSAADSSCKLDLGLVVDTTRSIGEGNIPTLKEALTDLVKQFTIAEDETHVSLETFAEESFLHNFFNDPNYHSQEAVVELIDSNINELTQPTRLDHALQMADEDNVYTREW